MKAGTAFEDLTGKIFNNLIKNHDYEKVERNVKLDGKDGKRQIDVLITAEVAGFKLKTVVECKDYAGKVSVGTVDALHSVMEDVNANKGVLVSSNGFSSLAIKKAKRLGISLYTAHEALSDKWKLDLEIPILVTDIHSLKLFPSFEAFIKFGTEILHEAIITVNDINLISSIKEDFKSISALDLAKLKESDKGYCPSSIIPPFFIRDSSGSMVYVKDFRIDFEFKEEYYFGYLHEQRDVLVLKDIIDSGINIMFGADFLIDYRSNLKKVNKEDIPSVGEVRIECFSEREFNVFNVDNIKFDII